MKRTIYLIMATLTLSVMSAWAQEIEVPDDAPRETWQLVYDDYRSICYYRTPEYKDLTMDVTVVRGENCLYIQGLAKSCPTSWVKLGEIDETLNNQFLLWSNQPVEAAGETQYLNTGTFEARFDSGHTYTELTIRCISGSLPLVFKRNLEADRLEYTAAERTGFWLDKEPDRGRTYTESEKWQTDGVPEPILIYKTEFPEAEVYVHPRLIDKTSGISSVNIADDEQDAPVYTLTGIRVDRNRLSPGIYVSRGRKFVVK